MRGDEREVLSALIDREPVDPDVLARVLEDPANRRLLVDFVRVRVAAQAEVPGEQEWQATAPLPAPQRRVVAGPWVRAAAALLLVAAGAGGGAWVHEYATSERPPEPDRVVQFEPGV
jgi:anti-sigma factor RsiW